MIDALVDLIVVTKMPQINEIMAAVHVLGARLPSRGDMTRTVTASNQVINRVARLYSEIWTLLAASRIGLFLAVSFFIQQSKPGAWGLRTGAIAHDNTSSVADAIIGLNQLKTRVVLVYGSVEMIFWLWVSASERLSSVLSGIAAEVATFFRPLSALRTRHHADVICAPFCSRFFKNSVMSVEK